MEKFKTSSLLQVMICYIEIIRNFIIKYVIKCEATVIFCSDILLKWEGRTVIL